MFCPKCGAEYRPGFTDCADCRVPLVQQPAESSTPLGQAELELVTIFESGNPALIALARSLLDSADIEYVTKGESLLDLFGAGPLVFQVGPEDAEEAKSLLRDLQESDQGYDDPGDGHDDVG